MQLPADFQARAQAAPVDGLGGRTRGEYSFAGYSGEFTRTESRLGVFEPAYESRRAASSFTIAGPGFGQPVSADCSARKQTVQVKSVAIDTRRMSYSCEFRSAGVPIDATFVLGQPQPDSTRAAVIAQASRVGEASFGAARITIRSGHHYVGSPLVADTPVGYLLERDGQLLATVELTDVNPTFLLAPGIEGDLRNSALLSALALAVFWDPDNSMLESTRD